MLTINSSRRQWSIYCLGRYCLADISLLLLCIIVKKCVVIRSILSSIGLLLDLAFHFLVCKKHIRSLGMKNMCFLHRKNKICVKCVCVVSARNGSNRPLFPFFHFCDLVKYKLAFFTSPIFERIPEALGQM